MKLCKDCKHAVWPAHPYSNYVPGIANYTEPMCGHPDARRSVVNGDLEVTCKVARGATTILNSCRDVICSEAKLFEERPPREEPRPGAVVYIEPPFEKPSFWRRIFG